MTEYEIMLIGEAFKDIKEVERICMENAKNNDGNTEIVDVIKLPNSRFNFPENETEDAE